MDWNLNKMWLAAATSLVAVTSVLSAADDMQMRNMENRLTALEQRKGANGMINPSARPGVRDGADIFITAAALYWKPNADSLEYAIDNTGDSPVFADSGEMKRSHGKWSWGFEVGLGYNMPHDGWDLYLNWTHFNGRSHHHHDDDDCCETTCSDIQFPVQYNWQTPDTPNCLYACDSEDHWKMRLNMVDLELGRDFFVSKYLSMRPFMGLRWLQLKHHHSVDYTGMFSSTSQVGLSPTPITNSSVAENEVRNRARFWGIGPRAGMNTLWGFGHGWGLYGNAAISLLYGKMKVHFKQDIEPTATSGEINNGRVHDHYHVTRAVTDLAIGLQWDHQFKDDAYHLGFSFGWEHHMFFGMNKFIRFHDRSEQGSLSTTHGDVATQGWTLAGRFDF